jgi:hypothetical protein
MLNYRGYEVIFTFNVYNTAIQTFYSGNFPLKNLLSKTDILYSDEFYNIISQNNKPTTIIFIDLIENKFDFNKRIEFDEKIP